MTHTTNLGASSPLLEGGKSLRIPIERTRPGKPGHAAHVKRWRRCMKIGPNRARLLVELPAGRYRILSSRGRAPRIGDVVVLDQGFTGSDGLPMVLAYFPGTGSDSLYEAEVYESELE